MIDINTIYNEDCLEGMKKLNDKSVDCIICDFIGFETDKKYYEIATNRLNESTSKTATQIAA